MGLRRFERVVVVAAGLALGLVGLVLASLELLPGAARMVLGIPLIGVGVVVGWAGVARWSPEVGSADRRETPELLLPIERLFLVPLVALGLAGLVAVLRDRDLYSAVKVGLSASTALVLAVTGGFVVGRIRVAPRDLGRRTPRPAGNGDRRRRHARRPG